jgi:hypothetical protein
MGTKPTVTKIKDQLPNSATGKVLAKMASRIMLLSVTKTPVIAESPIRRAKSI